LSLRGHRVETTSVPFARERSRRFLLARLDASPTSGAFLLSHTSTPRIFAD